MDKKELKEIYKQFKPEMGVYIFKCKPTDKVYLGYGQNVKGDINSITFQLNLGNFINSNLQSDWKKYGEAEFEIALIERLEYEKDELKTDYQTELRLLCELCSEKFNIFEFIKN